MSSKLTDNDYIHILDYYKLPIPKSKRMLKLRAEKIISSKLCRCIKKVEPTSEARSIGVCTKTIFNRKGLTRGKCNCKGKQRVSLKKTRKNM